MPSRKPSSPVLETGEDDMEPSDALALAEQAEAEAEEAEAAAAAARARARAIRLRNQATAQQILPDDDDAEITETPAEITATSATELTVESPDVESSADDAAAEDIDADEAIESDEADEDVEEPAKRRLRGIRVPRLFWKVFAACLTIIAICALLGASGWMIWQHRQAEHRQQLIAEYSAAARQSVVTLMSLDFNRAQDDVNRILDNSTGEFKADFEGQAKDFVKLATEAKVVTEATANAAAVDTMTDKNATVLVAVNTRVTNTTGANQEPRPWRVAVDLVREGDRIKLSKVEFVP